MMSEKPSSKKGAQADAVSNTSSALPHVEEVARSVSSNSEFFQLVGEVSWLMARTPGRQFNFFADLEWAVIPPILLSQAKLYRSASGEPVSFVTWAMVSEDVHERLRSGNGKLKPEDWRSGQHVWLVELIAPSSDAGVVLETLRKTIFAGKAVWVLQMGGKKLDPSTYNQ